MPETCGSGAETNLPPENFGSEQRTTIRDLGVPQSDKTPYHII